MPFLAGQGCQGRLAPRRPHADGDARGDQDRCQRAGALLPALVALAEGGEVHRREGGVYTLKDEKGNVRCVQQFPQVGIANKLAQQLTKLSRSSA